MAFCNKIRISYKAIKYQHVCWYIEYLACHSIAPASISNAVSHLRTFYSMSHLATAPLYHLRVQIALRAISTSIRHVSDPKEAVPPALLRAALAHVGRLPHPRAVKMALLLMFMGFLCQSNVAPTFASTFDPTRHLTCGDAVVTPLGLCIVVKWTKTIQASADATSVLLPATRDSLLCPVHAYQEYVQQAPKPGSARAPLLRHWDGNPLTVPYIRRQWALLLAIIGNSPAVYSLHSLRRGAAQYTYDCRADINDVMLQGTWKSHISA